MRDIFVSLLITKLSLASIIQIGLDNRYNGTKQLDSHSRIHNKLQLTTAAPVIVISCSLIILFLLFKYRRRIVEYFQI